ncbi:MAG: hypothetical protein OXG15_08575 [Gammaproteobacteria bacterium]|nr:hypothetical protein [Gammaproteobacteria bacterium]
MNLGINQRHVTLSCLTALLVCLLAVGVESKTFLRHVFQVLPIVLVTVLGLYRSRWTGSGALGLFACWAFFMLLIWLYLAGIQTFFTGNFTAFEIVLTVVIGMLSILGIAANVRPEPHVRLPVHLTGAVAFALLQLVVMWLSLFSHRIASF